MLAVGSPISACGSNKQRLFVVIHKASVNAISACLVSKLRLHDLVTFLSCHDQMGVPARWHFDVTSSFVKQHQHCLLVAMLRTVVK